MPSNKKPRKAYRPKPVLRDPLGHALGAFKTLPEDYRITSEVRHHGALTAMTTGKGSFHDWGVLCGVLNLARILADMGIGSDQLQLIAQAMQAHSMCGKRHVRAGSFGYTGSELAYVREALEVYEIQLENVTVREFDTASAELDRRVSAKEIDFSVIDKRS